MNTLRGQVELNRRLPYRPTEVQRLLPFERQHQSHGNCHIWVADAIRFAQLGPRVPEVWPTFSEWPRSTSLLTSPECPLPRTIYARPQPNSEVTVIEKQTLIVRRKR